MNFLYSIRSVNHLGYLYQNIFYTTFVCCLFNMRSIYIIFKLHESKWELNYYNFQKILRFDCSPYQMTYCSNYAELLFFLCVYMA